MKLAEKNKFLKSHIKNYVNISCDEKQQLNMTTRGIMYIDTILNSNRILKVKNDINSKLSDKNSKSDSILIHVHYICIFPIITEILSYLL